MDEVIRSRFHYQNHSDVVSHITDQPTEGIILNRNAELRKNKGAIQDLGAQSGDSWGRQVASIPFIMYQKALKDGYELNATDPEHRQKEIFRYLASDEGKLCKVY